MTNKELNNAFNNTISATELRKFIKAYMITLHELGEKEILKSTKTFKALFIKRVLLMLGYEDLDPLAIYMAIRIDRERRRVLQKNPDLIVDKEEREEVAEKFKQEAVSILSI